MIGQALGHYKILDKLGAGGMGEVYRAHDSVLDRDVAIKVLAAGVANDPDRLDRFEREAKAIARLSHPNILDIYELGDHEGRPFMVTELLVGETLSELLEHGSLGWRKATEIGAAIADGLAAAHISGVVHRDLKPSNIFVISDGCVKVIDFGLARYEPAGAGQDETAVQTMTVRTEPGTVLGTAPYMSPEQVRGEPVDPRSDIFSLGCVLHEMACGRRAFSRGTAVETMNAILKEPTSEIGASRPEVPPEFDRITAHCLEKNSRQRFQSASDLSFALRSLLTATDRISSGEHGTRPTTRDTKPSIAVLPFKNLSADPEQEYFCDGMAAEITNALVHVQGLRVVARTSAFAFKGKYEDVREIGGKLDVGAIVEGSVRKASDRLRITAQLIDVRDGSHLWSERFDRRLQDVFEIQDEISLAIVDSLKVRLLAREKVSLVRRHTDNLEAHKAYLAGLFEWNKMSPEGFVRCQELFQEAIHLDPDFAPAYAQLADSYTSVTWWADLPPTEALAQAVPLVEKALALDPNLAHAHSVMGQYNSFFERDLVAGEGSLRRAVEIAPSDALAQTYLALVLAMAGHGTEASERARTALRLDPLSPANSVWAGVVLLLAGHADEGRSVIERQVAMTPHLWMPRFWLGFALATDGRLAEARLPAEKALELSGGSSPTVFLLASICYRLGEKASGDTLFIRLQQQAQTGYVAPMFLAWVHLARGEPEAALRCAGEALTAKDPWVIPHGVMCPAIVPADPLVDDLVAGDLP